jgi:small subunit ribosomal protein S16
MLKIRLQRTGRKNVPTFRIVLTDSKNSTKSGKFIEVLGNHDPRGDKGEVKADKVKYWMSQGAQLTGTLHNLFIKKGIIKGEKVNKLPKNVPQKAPEEVVVEAPKKEESAPAPKEEVVEESESSVIPAPASASINSGEIQSEESAVVSEEAPVAVETVEETK